MSSITNQQAKLDLDLVPMEKRLEIGKCNGRLNPGKTQREPTFKMDRKKKFDLNLEIFKDIFQICPRVHGQNFDEPPTDDVIVSFFKELGHTGDIKLITDIFVDQMHQPWRTFATIINRNQSGKTTGLDKLQPTRKSKRVKRPAKKSTNAPTVGVVIRDNLVMSMSKKKEKVTVEKCKGINLLSKVALTEKAQYEEVHRKSLRDFHKTHPSGSGIVTSSAKIKPFVTNEGTSAKLGVPDVTEEESTESEAESWGRDEDDINNDHDQLVKAVIKRVTVVMTIPNLTKKKDETNVESKVEDKAEGDEDKGMDYTTNQFDDDVDVRLNKPVNTDEGFIQKEGTDAEMINVQQGNENMKITLNQVIEDAHVTISTITKKTEVLVTSSSHLSDLASKFLKFLDIPHTDVEIVSLMDVHVHHEKEVAELKKDDLLNTQVTAIVDEHLDSRLGATRDEFMSYLSASITARITEQVKIQLPQILPKEVSNFAPPMIKSMVTESLEHAVLAKESSQPQSTYEVAASLTEFELKNILIDKIDESQSYLSATEHGECYDVLINSYNLNKSLFSTYDKKRKTSKDDEPIKGLKTKESKSGSSKGTKSQSKSSGNSIHADEPKFEVADSDMPQDQEENLGNDDEEPKIKVASKCDWLTKPKQPQEPIDPDWNVGNTPQQGPTQSWLMTLAAAANKPSKTFDELMSTPIDFSVYIMNGLKITNLTQETLLGPAFKLLKGIRTNFAELEYDFEECYKALSEKLDWDNPKGGDYPLDLTKLLPLVMNENHQIVPDDYFFNNDLKYLQGGISTMPYTTSITKTKAAQYDLSGIEDMTFYGYARGLESSHDVYSTKRILAVTRVEVMRKHGYEYMREIKVRRADNELHTFKEGDFPRLCINDIEHMLILVVHNRLTNLSGNDVSDFAIALQMFTRSMVIQKRVEDLQLGVKKGPIHSISRP
ncbi:hypothetical protein Tco_0885986 [Tanacetum coccineum]